MKRFPWESLAAIVVGFAAGLFYAWGIAPIRYVDTTPGTLRADFKDQFRTAIAAAYGVTGNLERARARVALLGDTDPIQALTAQAQRMLAAGESFQTAQQLALLGSDLLSGRTSVVLPTATPGIATPAPPGPISDSLTPGATDAAPGQDETQTPTSFATANLSSPTPRPTRTPAPTAGAPFSLVSRDQVCNPNLTDGLLQIMVLDDNGHAMPGVEIAITSNAGEEHFFTGFKPEISDGYADYVMQAGTTYSLQIARSGAPASGMAAPSCTDSAGQSYLGGLKLTFRQP